jgi:hypothetical protein
MAGRFPIRTTLVLWLGATVGAACVLPYIEAIMPGLAAASNRLRVPVVVLVLLSVGQSAVTLGALTFSGLWAARKLGMGAPWLQAWLDGDAPAGNLRRPVITALALGVMSAVLLLVLDTFVFLPLSPDGVGRLLRMPQPPAWAGLLASFEGGITEEIELRLFLLSFLALGVSFATRLVARPATVPAVGTFWVANVVAGVLFGLGHLPLTARLVTLTPIVVARAIVLNGSLGLVTGYLFFRRGIELAILCHFSADIVMHVAAPMLQPWLLPH